VKTSRRGYWHGIAPSLLSVFAVNPHALSLVDLFRYIRHLQRNQQATTHYQLVFWYKVLAPLTTAAMVLLAVPFVFRHGRHGGLGFRLFLAVVLGLIFTSSTAALVISRCSTTGRPCSGRRCLR